MVNNSNSNNKKSSNSSDELLKQLIYFLMHFPQSYFLMSLSDNVWPRLVGSITYIIKNYNNENNKDDFIYIVTGCFEAP
jgi:hypothetical protein